MRARLFHFSPAALFLNLAATPADSPEKLEIVRAREGSMKRRRRQHAKPETAAPEDRDQLASEKGALRAQAAAVAAQQAALLEQEARLVQRQKTLDQQEAQLAAHLDLKRRRLVELRDQLQEARANLRARTETQQQEIERGVADIAAERSHLASARAEQHTMRQRLLKLRQRLKKRWHREWLTARQELQRRHDELASLRRHLEAKEKQLDGEQSGLRQERLRFNGEVELSRRKLDDAWQAYRQEQQQSVSRRFSEDEGRRRRERELDVGQRAVEKARSELDVDCRAWKGQRAELRQEIEGLNNRIANARARLIQQELEIVRRRGVLQEIDEADEPVKGATDAPPPEPSLEPKATNPDMAAATAVAERLERLAGELADQRAHLAEQFERLAAMEGAWRQERDRVGEELNDMAVQLEQREIALAIDQKECERRQAALRQARSQIESRQAQLQSQILGFSAERDSLTTELESQLEETARKQAQFRLLREHVVERQMQQTVRLKRAHLACERLRKSYTRLRKRCLRQSEQLVRQERDLAARTLAIEQFRQETIVGAGEPVKAERQVEVLRRQWSEAVAQSTAQLRDERESITALLRELDARASAVERQMEETLSRDREIAQREAAYEQARVVSDSQGNELRQTIRMLETRRGNLEDESAGLRQEVEQLARLLWDEADPVIQAAA
jgi:chromosome segregation ATPase